MVSKDTVRTMLVSALTSGITVAVLFLLAGSWGTQDNPLGAESAFWKENREGTAKTEEDRVVEIVSQANPAVVSVVVTKDIPVLERYYGEVPPFGGLFDEFFRDFTVPQYRKRGNIRREISGGSAFFVSADGLLVTNRHVVADAEAAYSVITTDGRHLEASVLARDPLLDIAVLQTEPEGNEEFPFLSFGDVKALMPGQTVIAIGNALGEFTNSVSVGVVSGLSRSIVAEGGPGESEVLEGVIQTDAAINPGNSGGPLLTLDGRIVGVNVAMQYGAENIGFALPADAVAKVVASVQEHGEIVRPYLGVRYTAVPPSFTEGGNVPSDGQGVLVTSGNDLEPAVLPNSPAEKAGIREGDVLLAIDGRQLTTATSLASLIREYSIGDSVTITLLRDGKEMQTELVLEKMPDNL